MASPFVPVPIPLDRVSSSVSNKLKRPPRASSLGSVSSSSELSSPITRSAVDEHGRCRSSQFQSRCTDRSSRSQTPPPQRSPVMHTRGNGTFEPSVEYSSCPRSISAPIASQQGGGGERPITPTVLGYEVMEERAKFTVYKVLVRKTTDESWVVFRRYADFSRLNDKLKEIFPGFRLALPPKRWFKDNYDSDFLEDRQLGLQAFLQNLVAHKDIANCQSVREFLCLDEPPGPFDSLEESRAFCETLEESNYRLQKELLEKQQEIASLKRSLQEKEQAILLMEKHINGECGMPQSPCGLSTQGSESSADADVESSSAAEADQDIPNEPGGTCEMHLGRSSACWCGPSISTSPPIIQVTQLDRQKMDS
ncbi:sorting nexin-16 isoform X2 [Phyllopteryx taeniolatus]|uniref:sorting nexin-16 isoform X2 n=1 Tax=Phyllopteryx taeniolatus TaxID=161469 RepID=UPI002AD43F35|nr:sorting nexin-16 isoform X2 [Phyllopteryx taeniolatus]